MVKVGGEIFSFVQLRWLEPKQRGQLAISAGWTLTKAHYRSLSSRGKFLGKSLLKLFCPTPFNLQVKKVNEMIRLVKFTIIKRCLNIHGDDDADDDAD